jgi:hypothetical protein
VDFTIADIMTLEGFETARNLLGYNPNAYMFHVCLVYSPPHWQKQARDVVGRAFPAQQANLRAFEYGGRRTSLFAMWVDRVYELVGRLNTLPVLTYTMDDMAGFYRSVSVARTALGAPHAPRASIVPVTTTSCSTGRGWRVTSAGWTGP